MKLKIINMSIASVALVCLGLTACHKNLPEVLHEGENITALPSEQNTINTTAVYSTRTIDFSRPNGSYSGLQAVEDFGNLDGGGWTSFKAFIQDSTFKVLLEANKVTDGGISQRANIAEGTEYELEYKVKFDSNFHFADKGKLGFGFFIGDGNVGCDPGWDGLGGSFRAMWVTRGADTLLVPYLYHKDQPNECGDSFMARYPATGSISKGVWYTVKMYIKSNTGSNTDGHAKMIVNGTVILDQAIRWTTDDLKKYINKLTIHTHRGGGDAASPTEGYIYYDDVKWTRLAP